jgi:IclR family pca regulon transcriptional regulator
MARRTNHSAEEQGEPNDPLMISSVEKAFRVLSAFDAEHQDLSLTQLSLLVGLDNSAVQRLAHTLVKLGYLSKDPETKRYELTVKSLELAYHYTCANSLIDRATPLLMHISKTTEEAVNLTVLDDTDVVFVSRLVSRHVLNTDVVVGTRLPAYCTAPGIAMMSWLPDSQVNGIFERSNLRAYTNQTTCTRGKLREKLKLSSFRGYATSFEEFYYGDLSVAAAVRNSSGHPIGALNIAASRARFTYEEAEEKFAPLVIAAARSLSQTSSR